MIAEHVVMRTLGKSNFGASAERQAHKPKRSYQKAPVRMRIDTTELYARCKDEQKNLTQPIGRGRGVARQVVG